MFLLQGKQQLSESVRFTLGKFCKEGLKLSSPVPDLDFKNSPASTSDLSEVASSLALWLKGALGNYLSSASLGTTAKAGGPEQEPRVLVGCRSLCLHPVCCHWPQLLAPVQQSDSSRHSNEVTHWAYSQPI